MSERYKAFIRELKARMLETGTTPAAVCYGVEQAKQDHRLVYERSEK